MMFPKSSHYRFILSFFIAALIVIAAGCNGAPAPATAQESSTPAASPTPIPPTPTSEPQAVMVNGQGISLALFQSELGRYQTAQTAAGNNVNQDQARQTVLDDLVDQMLLAQAAEKGGYKISDAAVQARIDQLATSLGGKDALAAWLEKYNYSEADFSEQLRLSMAAAWERDQIAAQVPQTAEQVHARQILVYDADTAQKYLAKLKAGADFATLAQQLDPVTGGDLGWFPRGYLTDPEVEKAAFALQPGQYSDVVQAQQGYLIIQVIARDTQHPLSPDARLALQKQALQKWLQDQRTQSKVQVLAP
jgi:peptidyl-prolyl cis-trans isomerase C